MELVAAVSQILEQLDEVLEQIKGEDYSRPSAILSNSTIGQHTRHTLEFFICLNEGLHQGEVNYDKRKHDPTIQEQRDLARRIITELKQFVAQHTADRPMTLAVSYDPATDAPLSIPTNYFRELAYNIEHAVHHMAIIKIGLRDVAPYVQLPAGFGIATSTIRHQQSQQAGS